MKPLLVRRYTLLAVAGRTVRRLNRGPICGVQGCRQWGNPCWLPDDDWNKPSSHYCYDHMHNQGFCPGCGNFWAGVESFDFSRSGYCENCAGDAGLDDDDSDYWEDDLMDWDDYPHMQVMK